MVRPPSPPLVVVSFVLLLVAVAFATSPRFAVAAFFSVGGREGGVTRRRLRPPEPPSSSGRQQRRPPHILLPTSTGLAAKKKKKKKGREGGGGGGGSSSSSRRGFGGGRSPSASAAVAEEEIKTNGGDAGDAPPVVPRPGPSPIHADLLSWLRLHPDTYISPNFAIRPSDLGGYGGFASSPIPANELIFRIPRECCVTFDDALNDPDCGEAFQRIKDSKAPSWGMVLIAGWIAKERLLMEEYCDAISASTGVGGGGGGLTTKTKKKMTNHRSYLESLPWERGTLGQDHVLFWSDDDVDSLLGGSMAYDDAVRIRRTVDDAIELLGEFVIPIVRDARARIRGFSEGDGGSFADDLERAVRGAFVIALSRSFAEEVENDDDGSVEVENLLIPLVDVLQHSNAPNTVLETYDDCILVRAGRDGAGTGEELFNQYQEEDDEVIPPHRFFTRYGFVPGANAPVDRLLRERSPLFFDQREG